MSKIYLLKYNNYYNRMLKQETDLIFYKNYLVKYIDADGKQSDTDEYDNSNIMEDINFALGDNVNTSLVCNWTGEVPDYLVVTDMYKRHGTNEATGEPIEYEVEAISSRWFVTNFKTENYTQNTLTLYRDLLVDHLEEIKDQPIFIEKGTPTDINDPAIFNSENMGFNQIKKDEILLQDRTKSAWLVGYMPRDFKGQDKIDIPYTQENVATLEADSVSAWEYASYVNGTGHFDPGLTGGESFSGMRGGFVIFNGFGAKDTTMDHFNGFGNDPILTEYQGMADAEVTVMLGETNDTTKITKLTTKATKVYARKASTTGHIEPTLRGGYNYYYTASYAVFGTNDTAKWRGIFGYLPNVGSVCEIPVVSNRSDWSSEVGGGILLNSLSDRVGFSSVSKILTQLNRTDKYVTQERKKELDNLNGKVLHVKTSDTGEKYYLVHTVTGETNVYGEMPSLQLNSINLSYRYTDNGGGTDNRYTAGSSSTFRGAGTFIMKYVYLWLEDISGEIIFDIAGPSNRYHLKDQPYDMFCIPYPVDSDFYIKYTEGGQEKTLTQVDAKAGLLAATGMSAVIGSANIVDLQLLPYCPIPGVMEDHGIDCTTYTHTWIETALNSSSTGTKLNIILFASQSDFSLDLNYNIDVADNVEEKKIRSETEVWRLSSPNYAGIYEFNPQMNGGVEAFHIDCTYKPFSPYIHVHPKFGQFYGKDFEDARGLICGGDFSLPIISDAWTEYQYNNKNYQEIFDRGIQNQETNNAYQRTIEEAEYKMGNFEAYIAGRQYGSQTWLGLGSLFGQEGKWGNKYQSMAEEVGKVDLEMNNALRQESIDYTKDLFGYQMGNIQALSQSLVKVSAFTKSNKLWPFLEQYGCDLDDQTVQTDALKNKLKYNGYTIMRIDKLANFINVPGSYIKGQLIRLPESFDSEYHIGVALTKELDKGFYTPEVQ